MIPSTIPTQTMRTENDELATALQKVHGLPKTIEREVGITRAYRNSRGLTSAVIEVEGSPPKGMALATIEGDELKAAWVQTGWDGMKKVNKWSRLFVLIAEALSLKLPGAVADAERFRRSNPRRFRLPRFSTGP